MDYTVLPFHPAIPTSSIFFAVSRVPAPVPKLGVPAVCYIIAIIILSARWLVRLVGGGLGFANWLVMRGFGFRLWLLTKG